MSPELEQAIKERVELGHSKEQITAELHAAGYDDATVETVYATVTGVAPSAAVRAAELPATLALFKKAWSFMLSRLDLVLLFAVPTLLINAFALTMEFGWVPMGPPTVLVLVLGIVALVAVQFLVQLTIAHTVLKAQQSHSVTVAESWQWAVGNVWSWLWIATLSFCLVFGGFLLLIVPGVIISFYIAFAMYVFIDEGKLGMSALQRSRELVMGNFWEILKRFVLFMLILLGIGLLVGVVIGVASTALGLIGEGVSELTVAVFDAFITAAATLLGIHFASGLYIALKQRATIVETANSYVPIGWLGAVVLLFFTAIAVVGVVTLVSSGGLNDLDFEQIMNPDSDAMMVETQAELSPEQQAEFDAFIEEFGEDLDSF